MKKKKVTKKKKKRIKWGRFFISSCIILGLFIFGSIKLIDLVKNIFGYGDLGLEKVASVEYKEPGNFVHALEDGFIVCYKNRVAKYDVEGKEEWQINKTIKSPIIRNGENVFFLGDKDTGQILKIDTEGYNLQILNIQKPMKNFICNKKGEIVVHYKDDEGEGIQIIDGDGINTGSIRVGKKEILDMAISENKDMVAVSVMAISNDQLVSNIVLYSKEGKLLGGNEYEKQVITNLFFSEDNKLIHVGDKRLMAFEKEKKKIWDREFQDSIHSVDWNDRDFVVMHFVNNKKSIMDTKNTDYILVVNKDNVDLNKISMNEDLLGIDTKGENIIAFNERTIYFMPKLGKKIIEKKINNDIQTIQMISENEFIVGLKNKIEVMRVKKEEK